MRNWIEKDKFTSLLLRKEHKYTCLSQTCLESTICTDFLWPTLLICSFLASIRKTRQNLNLKKNNRRIPNSKLPNYYWTKSFLIISLAPSLKQIDSLLDCTCSKESNLNKFQKESGNSLLGCSLYLWKIKWSCQIGQCLIGKKLSITFVLPYQKLSKE